MTTPHPSRDADPARPARGRVLLVAADGLLPHAATLARTLAALRAARPSDAGVAALLDALAAAPARFEVTGSGA